MRNLFISYPFPRLRENHGDAAMLVGEGAASIAKNPRIKGLLKRRCNENILGACKMFSEN